MDHTTEPAFEPLPDRKDPMFFGLMLASSIACLECLLPPRPSPTAEKRARALVAHFHEAMEASRAEAEVERTVAYVRDAVAGTEHEFKEPTP